MSQKAKKAVVATVNYAGFQFSGLKLPDGRYGLTASQAWSMLKFSDLHQNASRDIKRLLSKDFQTFRYASELNPKKVNIILLQDFSLLVMKLAFKGNKAAQAIAEASVTTTLEQAYDLAFNNKQALEEYQERQKARVQGKLTRRTLTNAIQDYVNTHVDEVSDNYQKWIYNNCTDALNRLVFGRSAKKLRENWSCLEVRSAMNTEELMIVDSVERLAVTLIDELGFEPLEAIKEAGNRLLIKKIER